MSVEHAQLCECLDDCVDQLMTQLAEIIQLQEQLETCVRAGYLHISKARYQIGVNRVSSLVYNMDDLGIATSKVTVTTGDVTSFSLDDLGSECDGQGEGQDGLRQRKKDQDVTEAMDNVNLADKTEQKPKKSGSVVPPSHVMRWFGVLAPRPLRQCQGEFQRATEIACDLASLKSQFQQRQTEYREKLHRKHQLELNNQAENVIGIS